MTGSAPPARPDWAFAGPALAVLAGGSVGVLAVRLAPAWQRELAVEPTALLALVIAFLLGAAVGAGVGRRLPAVTLPVAVVVCAVGAGAAAMAPGGAVLVSALAAMGLGGGLATGTAALLAIRARRPPVAWLGLGVIIVLAVVLGGLVGLAVGTGYGFRPGFLAAAVGSLLVVPVVVILEVVVLTRR